VFRQSPCPPEKLECLLKVKSQSVNRRRHV
jgi:hypothetical protein